MTKQIDNKSQVDKVRIQFDSSGELNQRLESYSNNNGISKSGAIRMILNQNLPEGEA
jgi:predicted DNA-binding protein